MMSAGEAARIRFARAKIARTPLAVLPTPLVEATRLAEALGTGPLFVKRDDLTGFAFGGNKARLLEFLLAAAAELAADGRRPYLIPRGGATALGAIGYALAAAELHEQLAERGLPLSRRYGRRD